MLKFLKDPYEIGVDESGRGPLLGRVYAACVIWGNLEKDEKNEEYYNLVIDSKKLDKKKRQKVLNWIKENVVMWGMGYADPEEIDKLNILEATCLAMKRSIDDLENKLENTSMYNCIKEYKECKKCDKICDYHYEKDEKCEKNVRFHNLKYPYPNNIIIDGCRWEKRFPEYDYSVTSVVKGDDKYLSIAAASILAKEYHDEHIKELCKLDPELDEKYNILNNMGYPTKAHMVGIKKYGPSIYHRKSFKPCNL